MLPNEDDYLQAFLLAQGGKSCKEIFEYWEKQPEFKALTIISSAIMDGLDTICIEYIEEGSINSHIDRLELPSEVTTIMKEHYQELDAKRVPPARVRQLTASPAATYQLTLFKEVEDEQCHSGATSEAPTKSSAPKRDGKA